ncbi:hypothetical protein DS031_10270 [Bacillus taeanensis]|uniref:Uncharacterized protein n=1 Tax=Bacillus taeanensis TaxID=273032 RepID=A0A366XVC3_9BACI|nr:hypothetical protein DS031_10270 [Bacillus taeanensis]
MKRSKFINQKSNKKNKLTFERSEEVLYSKVNREKKGLDDYIKTLTFLEGNEMIYMMYLK